MNSASQDLLGLQHTLHVEQLQDDYRRLLEEKRTFCACIRVRSVGGPSSIS
jgi:hypothetical protein